MPEQILGSWTRASDAALIDRWGRVFRLDPQTRVGRTPGRCGVVVVQASVSREHATLTQDANGSWWLVDRGSTNATQVNGRTVRDTLLFSGDRITFGDVGFFFVHHAALLEADHDDVDEPTPPPIDQRRLISVPEAAETSTVEIRLLRDGSTGIVDLSGRRIRLSENQYAMVLILARRMEAERALPVVLRGFVPSSQLLADLLWETDEPSDSHLKQLVRRTRRLLAESGVDLIESRRGLGYRLRAVPTIVEPR